MDVKVNILMFHNFNFEFALVVLIERLRCDGAFKRIAIKMLSFYFISKKKRIKTENLITN